MAWQIVSEVLDVPVTGEFTSEMKFVALVYANYAKPDGSDAYPSTETVSRLTGYHERSVQRYRARLEEIGVLVRDGIGRGGTKKYKVVTSGGGDRQSPHETGRGDIPSGDIPSGDRQSPKPNKPFEKEQQQPPQILPALAMFESEICKASPIIKGEIEKAVQAYSHDWVMDAIREAVISARSPSWKYISAILARWKSEGREKHVPTATKSKALTKYEEMTRAGYDVSPSPEVIAEINRRQKAKREKQRSYDPIDAALGTA